MAVAEVTCFNPAQRAFYANQLILATADGLLRHMLSLHRIHARDRRPTMAWSSSTGRATSSEVSATDSNSFLCLARASPKLLYYCLVHIFSLLPVCVFGNRIHRDIDRIPVNTGASPVFSSSMVLITPGFVHMSLPPEQVPPNL